jgi:hypothetical protein
MRITPEMQRDVPVDYHVRHCFGTRSAEDDWSSGDGIGDPIEASQGRKEMELPEKSCPRETTGVGSVGEAFYVGGYRSNARSNRWMRGRRQ